MQVPLEIRFHNLPRSAVIERAVRERAAKLERFADHIVSCRVTVEAPHKHQQQGNHYRISVDVRMPGGEVVASRDPPARQSHEDVFVALADAFKAIRRQVQDYVRAQRGNVKVHEAPPHGRILALHPEKDYGRIATPEGREIYFHRNSVVNADFDRLEPGLEVRFNEESGDLGPQASTVHVVGKQNHHSIP